MRTSYILATGLCWAAAAASQDEFGSKAPQKGTTHVLHERHAPHMAQHWEKRDKLDKTAILPMRIGLTQSNLDRGHEKLIAMLVLPQFVREARRIANQTDTDRPLGLLTMENT